MIDPVLPATAALPLLLARQQPPTSGDAPEICLVGLAVVFSGLVLLCLFMLGLMRLLEPRREEPYGDEEEAAEPEYGPEEGSAGEEEEPETAAAAAPPEPEEPAAAAGEWTPEERPELVPMTLLAAAVMAHHLYERNLLQLGRPTSFLLLGRERQVTLLSAGHVNRALVDGEEVVFNLSEVAGNDAVGRSIAPADF